MITLSIADPTPEGVAEKLQGMFRLLLVSQAVADGVANVTTAPTEEPKQEVLPPEKPKATRAKKAEPKPEPKQIDLEEAIAEKTAVPPIEDVRAALMKLAKEKGDDDVWNMLEKYKAKSASTVPEAKRAELIAEIDEACK